MGVPQDNVQAYMYLILASAGGIPTDPAATPQMAAARMTPDDLARARAATRDHLAQHPQISQ
jgi:hypothetical protein